MTNHTAAQPLDLDKLEALARNRFNGGLSLSSEEALALIAQARAAKVDTTASASIDTPEFRDLLDAYSNWSSRVRLEKLIAHIDTWAARGAGEAVSAGFKLVPIEPTEEMLRVSLATEWPAIYRKALYEPLDGPGMRADTDRRVEVAKKRYAAMLAAAPAPGNTAQPSGKEE